MPSQTSLEFATIELKHQPGWESPMSRPHGTWYELCCSGKTGQWLSTAEAARLLSRPPIFDVAVAPSTVLSPVTRAAGQCRSEGAAPHIPQYCRFGSRSPADAVHRHRPCEA